jgi:GxxExxY protein
MQKGTKIRGKDIIYPDLSYKIMGVIFSVNHNLGYGYNEKHYQKAIALALEGERIKFKREAPVKVLYKGKELAKLFLDFLIEDKIVLEIKQGDKFYSKDISQTYKYLVATKLKLGILVRFTRAGVKYKRIVNID